MCECTHIYILVKLKRNLIWLKKNSFVLVFITFMYKLRIFHVKYVEDSLNNASTKFKHRFLEAEEQCLLRRITVYVFTLHMCFQIICACKTLLTHRTRMRFLPSMRQHVMFQMLVGCKPTAAHCALERSFSSMYDKMTF